ncbi:MAG: FAD:protein FMN transferase [Calditrichaeota bacterium]|nr:FAD:protein FMN transferase [Calditrichota bacterium]
MGSRFEFIAVSGDSVSAKKSIQIGISEVRRLEQMISSWDDNSETSRINQNAGIMSVEVSPELFGLIKRSKKVSVLTDGIFDISYASMDKIWKFDGSMTTFPDSSLVKESVAKINYQDIELEPQSQSVFLRKKGMKIGFGGIGKGFAANVASKKMRESGIENGVVNAGGDLISWGNQADGKPWQIAVTDPKDKKKTIGWLDISNTAVVTSGNYEKFVEFNGQKYTHIINPKTGYPVFGTRSVTIICPDAELADALATSVFILGEKKGLELINTLKGIECFLITDRDELKSSSGLQINYL